MSFPAHTHSVSGAQPRAMLHAKTLAMAGIIGPVGFTTLVIVQGFLLPDYSHVSMPISALAAWPTGWIQILNFCVSGALIVAFAFGLHMGVQPARRGAMGVALLVASGVGLIGTGVFSWKMIDGVPTETPAHAAAAILSFAATGLGLIIFSRRMNADLRWRDLTTFTRIAGIVVLLLFVTVGFFAIDDGAPLHPWAGLIQRILCAVWFTCLVVLAFRLRSLGSDMAVRGVHVSS
jgi:hypothetical membrane protein